MSYSMSKSDMASFDLGGHGGQPNIAHDLLQTLMRPHAKNQQPGFETVAVNREQTPLQTPGTNLQLYIKIVKSFYILPGIKCLFLLHRDVGTHFALTIISIK